MNTFNKGGIVQCSDQKSRYYMDGGIVTETVNGMSRVQLYMNNRNVPFHNDQLILIQAVSGATQAAAVMGLTPFKVGDRVRCKIYGDTGTVTAINGKSNSLDIDLDSGKSGTWNAQYVELLSPGVAKIPVTNPSGVTCHSQIGDDVKYIGSDKKMIGARGKVLNIYKIVVPTGKDYLAALVCVQWGNEEIPCDSLLAIAPMGGSHYQAVVDSDGPKYDSYSDQDIENHEKEPFRHTDLGTDLSGDELMDSIRSICGR